MTKRDYVFHRNLKKTYPLITYGQGVYLYDSEGKKYLDGSSGAVAANLGHGCSEIVDAMAEQARRVAFVHTLRFETEVLHDLAAVIASLAPPPLNRVYFSTGGSEANESAIKLARQYHRDRGSPERYIVLGRWQSYHGNTLGSLAAGGDVKRREPYLPLLAPYDHVHSPYCHRCPYGKQLAECQARSTLFCVEALENRILAIGPERISAFICEPIIGSQQGAVVPPLEYLQQVRTLCDQYEIILIIDEVMTGFGRTGAHFALEHFGVVPDILTFGKGVSAGYAPLSGMVVHDHLIDSLLHSSQGRFIHGYTYSGHPVSLSAGYAALQYYHTHGILQNCRAQGRYLSHKLQVLREKHACIGEIRGQGLLIGLELLQDRDLDQHFSPTQQAAEMINHYAMQRGLLLYPGSGSIDGVMGEHLLIAPPLTIKEREIDQLVMLLDQALTDFTHHLSCSR